MIKHLLLWLVCVLLIGGGIVGPTLLFSHIYWSIYSVITIRLVGAGIIALSGIAMYLLYRYSDWFIDY